MNDLFARWGLLWLKPLLEATLLSALPLYVMAFSGLAVLRRRRRLGIGLVAAGLVGLWTISTAAFGAWVIDALTRPPPPLDEPAIAALKGSARTAIVVLGAGRRVYAPEYDGPDLKSFTAERLRYGLWLGRRTGLPVVYSAGVGWGSPAGPTEAEVAKVVAERDFRLPLRWVEDRSRDTAENAAHSVALLRAQGIERIVIVTHGFHQQRARAAFERALAHQATPMALVSAGVGLRRDRDYELSDFLPGPYGLELTLIALHEWLGRLAQA